MAGVLAAISASLLLGAIRNRSLSYRTVAVEGPGPGSDADAEPVTAGTGAR